MKVLGGSGTCDDDERKEKRESQKTRCMCWPLVLGFFMCFCGQGL